MPDTMKRIEALLSARLRAVGRMKMTRIRVSWRFSRLLDQLYEDCGFDSVAAVVAGTSLSKSEVARLRSHGPLASGSDGTMLRELIEELHRVGGSRTHKLQMERLLDDLALIRCDIIGANTEISGLVARMALVEADHV